MADFLFQEQGIEIGFFQTVKVQPQEGVRAMPFNGGKAIAPFKKIGLRNIHEKIDAELMVVQPVHVLREKGLIQPQRTDDPCVDPKLFLYFPKDGLFRGFAELYPAAGQIVVGWRSSCMARILCPSMMTAQTL